MQQWNMEANVITYHVTISTCEKGQQCITAISKLPEMLQCNINADVITYNVAISAFEKGRRWIIVMSSLRAVRQ